MKILVTGPTDNNSKKLKNEIVQNEHSIKVISSKADREKTLHRGLTSRNFSSKQPQNEQI